MDKAQFAALISSDAQLERAINGFCARIQLMNRAELRKLMMTRFELGEARYGPLNLNDGRDWRSEELDEGVDGVIYRLFLLEQAFAA